MSGATPCGGYQVTVEKRYGGWLVRVQDVGVTQAQSLMEMEPLAQDLVACLTGEDPADIRLTWSIPIRVEVCEGGWELQVGDIGVRRCASLADAEWEVQEFLETILEQQPATTDLTWDITAGTVAPTTTDPWL